MTLDRAWWRFVIPRLTGPLLYLTARGELTQDDEMRDRFCGTREAAAAECSRRSALVNLGTHPATVLPAMERIEGEWLPEPDAAEILGEVRRILRTPEGGGIVEHALAVRALADVGERFEAFVREYREGGS